MSTTTAVKSPKENSKENKVRSTNNKRFYIDFGSLYLFRLGFTIKFGKETRIAKKLKSNFPIEKIINPQGIVVFDHTKNYQIKKSENGLYHLVYDKDGIPLETNEIVTITKKRIEYNELVVMDIIREYMNRCPNIKEEVVSIQKTKTADNKLSSTPLKKVIFINIKTNSEEIICTEEALKIAEREIYPLLYENLSRKQGKYDSLILGSQLTPGKKDLVILTLEDNKEWSCSGQSTNSLSVPIDSFNRNILINSPISQQPIICEELPHAFNFDGLDSTNDEQETESYPLEMKEDKEVTMDEVQMDNGSLPVNLTNNGVYYDMNGQSMECNVSHMGVVDEYGQVLDHLIVQPTGYNVYSFVIDDGNGQQGYMFFDDTNNQQFDDFYFDHNSLKTSHEDDYEPEENKGFIQSQ